MVFRFCSRARIVPARHPGTGGVGRQIGWSVYVLIEAVRGVSSMCAGWAAQNELQNQQIARRGRSMTDRAPGAGVNRGEESSECALNRARSCSSRTRPKIDSAQLRALCIFNAI